MPGTQSERRESKMKHTSNVELFKYWNKLRGTRLAPDRSEIDPGEIRKVLGDTFVFEADGHGNFPFRIAGTRLCALFGRELKGESFVNLWHQSGQTTVRELIAAVMEEKVGLVAKVTGTTANSSLLAVNLEMLLLPLAYNLRSDARVLGALAPMGAPYWLGAKAMGLLSLGTFRHIGPVIDQFVAPRLTAGATRQKHGLTVHIGGRTE